MPRSSDRPRLVLRPHGVVLAGPLMQALALSLGGLVTLVLGGRVAVAGVLGLVAGALVALRAVWRWERTRIVVTRHEVALVQGTLRRRSASVPLGRGGAVEVEQSLLGRMLGYGTVVIAELELPYVARPRELERRLAAG